MSTTATESMTLREAQNQLDSIERDLTDRNNFVRALTYHNVCAEALRQRMPKCLKSFFYLWAKPENLLIYAESAQEAMERGVARLNKSYPQGWKFAHDPPKLDPMTSEKACANSPGSLLSSLPKSEADEFLSDWDKEKPSRDAKEKLKDCGMSAIEKDVENYRTNILLNEKP